MKSRNGVRTPVRTYTRTCLMHDLRSFILHTGAQTESPDRAIIKIVNCPVARFYFRIYVRYDISSLRHGYIADREKSFDPRAATESKKKGDRGTVGGRR